MLTAQQHIIVACDSCDRAFDEDGEGVCCFASVEDVRERFEELALMVGDSDEAWQLLDDGRVYCGLCAPADSEDPR